MTFPSFSEFFAIANGGREPFPWQEALADRVTREGWPEALTVPTGLGKTAVLDIALYALAAQADRAPAERTAATRTFLVVDRRIVVDQAHDRIAKLVDMLEAVDDGPLVSVAAALRAIGQPDASLGERLVEVVRMRGGATWASRWVRRPDLPAVVIGTVDQFGSRLLFRGYGVGQRRSPMDAALTGCDALLVVDEAHLSAPFLATVEAVTRCEATADDAVLPQRPLRTVRMSATLADARSEQPVSDADRSHPVAGARLRASKRAELVQIPGKPTISEQARAFAALARSHLARPDVRSVAVIVNTVGLARATFDLLRPATAAALLVGRVRGFDREGVSKQLMPFRHEADGEDGERDVGPQHVLVATQTVEVGVDIDVDSLVCQAAPLDSLVQRFGRLDRFGRRGVSEATIVAFPDREDPVYGERTDTTWTLLSELAEGVSTLGAIPTSIDQLEPTSVDMGIEDLEGRLAGIDLRPLVARRPDAPVVLGAVLHAWARTSPLPVPDEPVAPYLHGTERPPASVSVVWRAVPQSGDGRDAHRLLRGAIELLPVRPEELVEVPIRDVCQFLMGEFQDAAGPDVSVPAAVADGAVDTPAVIGDGVDLSPVTTTRDIRPGRVLVLPTWAGGYDAWGWSGRRDTGPVRDVADDCAPGTLRLQRSVLANRGVEDKDLEDAIERLLSAVADEAQDEAPFEELAAAIEGVAPPGLDRLTQYELGGLEKMPTRNRIVVVPLGPIHASDGADFERGVLLRWRSSSNLSCDIGDDSDAGSSLVGEPVELGAHCRAVQARAEAISTRLGLDPRLGTAVSLAAVAHDLGKADPRFQALLRDGDRRAVEMSDRLLAKSGRRQGWGSSAGRLAGWPPGMRHEALSLTVVEELLRRSGEQVDAELVRHLVISHHGHGRPLLPARDTKPPVPFSVADPIGSSEGPLDSEGIEGQVDWDHPSSFRRLCQRYGWWGLALLEAVVRAADHCASEEGT